jgi:hypothetical protein
MFRVTTIVPNADGRKTPSALALLRKHLSSASHLGGSRLSSDGASRTSYAIRRLRRLRFKSSPQVLSSQVRNRNQLGIPPSLAPTHPELLMRTCAREQPPNPTCPHRLLFHHTHVTQTWAIASLPLRHRSAGAGACTRTPGRRGRQPWR